MTRTKNAPGASMERVALREQAAIRECLARNDRDWRWQIVE